jgi:hypothetical protein
MTPEQKANRNRAKRLWAARAVAQGRCRECNKPVEPGREGKNHCAACSRAAGRRVRRKNPDAVKTRPCGVCGEHGHNRRTCKKAE